MSALPFRVITAAAAGFVGYVAVLSFFAILHMYRVNDGPLPYGGFAAGAVVGWTWASLFAKKRGWTAKANDGPPLIVEERDTWTYVYARPRALPFRITVASWLLALGPAIATGFLAVSGMSRPPIPLFALIVGIVLVVLGTLVKQAFVWFHDTRRQVRHHGFEVSPLGLMLANGTSIPIASIAQVAIHNTLEGRVVVAAGSSVAMGVAQMGLETQRQISQVSYAVAVEHRGTRTVLAGGLDETLARAVMREITSRLPRFTV
jgi:hypothetical protein